ncbi:MAG TPA: hypothetical protein VJ420_04670 [Candidatus Udaeobacter sp.]|nr:hypothetical protein [Candidatus Udaeobacter sp.]
MSQARGGGIGGRSIRAEAVASSVNTAWPVKRGFENPSEVGQKRISVEHEIVQQLRRCDSPPPHRLSDDCSCAILQADILEQQAGAFVIAVTFDLAMAGQRKLPRHTINSPLITALRMTT